MPKTMSHTECFDFYGTVPKNIRWSWSGKSLDGKIISVTFWKDKFENGGKSYRSVSHLPDDKWVGSPGHNELIENLKHSFEKCDGILHVIIALAKDVNASPRSIAECYPAKGLIMRLTHFDETTGDFVAERV
jgi:hypothetical protein